MKPNPSNVFSVITIHGLTGHPINTWTQDRVCWPRDLLPQAVPAPIRVFSFGYHAHQFGGYADLDIEDAALQLIDQVESVRTDPEVGLSTPLIAPCVLKNHSRRGTGRSSLLPIHLGALFLRR